MQYLRALIILFFVLNSLTSLAIESVTLQLKWKHQFQFAGYYAAQSQGYYKDVGLNVFIKEAQLERDPVENVLDGGAEYGVGTSELILLKHQGEPVVVLAVIFQYSSLALVSLRSNNIHQIDNLQNKALMIEANSAELFSYLALEGLHRDQLNIVPHSFNIQDLLSNKIAGMSVYTTDELYLLDQADVQYSLFEPSAGGVDFYGDNLFTTQNELTNHPERVKAFREASLRGWLYAMAHPDEIVELIYTHYSQRHSKEHLMFEAKAMRNLMRPDLVEPGYMHIGRWQDIAKTYVQQNMLPKDHVLASDFLYQPDGGVDGAVIKRWVFVIILIIVAVFSALFYVWSLNKRLRENQVWLSAIVDNAPTALMILDENAKVIEWNHQAELVFGWLSGEVIGKEIFDFMIPDADKVQVRHAIDSTFNEGGVKTSENWNRTKSGKVILCEWQNTALKKNRIISMAVDVTERKELENKLMSMAHTDSLTGIANRALFFQKLEQAILLAKRQNQQLAILFIDLDDFKIVNDQYGHEVGDVVLCEVVQRIKIAVREADLLARIGGDEFVLMLYNCDTAEKAEQVAEKVLQTLERPLQVMGLMLTVGGSIGISFYPEHGKKTSDILKSADRAMYEVKQQQKNGIGFAPPRKRRPQ